MKNKNKKLLEDFIKYCKQHPEMRFWQALRNWSKANKILYETTTKEDYGTKLMLDTFYWNNKKTKL